MRLTRLIFLPKRSSVTGNLVTTLIFRGTMMLRLRQSPAVVIPVQPLNAAKRRGSSNASLRHRRGTAVERIYWIHGVYWRLLLYVCQRVSLKRGMKLRLPSHSSLLPRQFLKIFRHAVPVCAFNLTSILFVDSPCEYVTLDTLGRLSLLNARLVRFIMTTHRQIALMLMALLSSSSGSFPFHNRRYCGVAAPSSDLLETHNYLHNNEGLNNDLWNSTTLLAYHHLISHSKRQTSSTYYTIDTYFHVVADTNSSDPSSPNYVTDEMVSNQFLYLSQAYSSASIGYNLLGVTRSTNDTWAANGDDLGMKTALRNGTYSTLNVYFQSQLQAGSDSPGVPAGSTLLGFCSLPAAGVTPTTTTSLYVLDGCNVLSGTMPGGQFTGYNLGGTTVHEAGHWNGLLHPFQDNTCSPSDFGDYVADTPQEMTSTSMLRSSDPGASFRGCIC